MNWDQIEGKWEQLKGQLKETWGKLTDNDIAIINGKKDQLVGRLQEKYGYNEAEATSEIAAFVKKCNNSSECGSEANSKPVA
jgi:uncharacterized protein YjbJ (UPF0337 family)